MGKFEKVYCCNCKHEPSLLDKIIIGLAYVGAVTILILILSLFLNF